MRLVSFTVEKYRSITNAKKIGIDKSVTLVGPNNEGKSNLLRALVAAMNILTKGHRPVFLLKGKATVKVHKKGKGATTLSKKSKKIALFIARRLDFEQIPAVRTADAAQQIVNTLVEKELSQLEENENKHKNCCGLFHFVPLV